MLTDRQRKILWITLGLYKSDQYQLGMTNHFCAGVEDEPVCLELVDLGYMREHSPSTKMLFRLFSVTEAGKRALESEARDMLTQIYKCDVCGKTLASGDFWWSIDVAPDSARIDVMPFTMAQEWIYDGDRFDLCGKEHAAQKLMELMADHESNVLTLEAIPKTLPVSRGDRSPLRYPDWVLRKQADSKTRGEDE